MVFFFHHGEKIEKIPILGDKSTLCDGRIHTTDDSTRHAKDDTRKERGINDEVRDDDDDWRDDESGRRCARAGGPTGKSKRRTRVLFLVAEKSKLAFDEIDCDAGD